MNTKTGRSANCEGRAIEKASCDKSCSKKISEEEVPPESGINLRDFTAHLQYVREAERKRIAREIHDELAQTIALLKMDVSWLQHKIPLHAVEVHEKIQSVMDNLDNTIGNIERIITNLRPGLLHTYGLEAALEWFIEEFRNRSGIECDFFCDIDDTRLNSELSANIFRIVQESLTNSLRHAKATKVKVSLECKSGQFMIMVRDNGNGITEDQIKHPKSFGIIGMMERVSYFEGIFKIKGVKNKGTVVTVSIPLA